MGAIRWLVDGAVIGNGIGVSLCETLSATAQPDLPAFTPAAQIRAQVGNNACQRWESAIVPRWLQENRALDAMLHRLHCFGYWRNRQSLRRR